MDCRELFFSAHALRRMFERVVSVDEVRHVIATGEVVAAYPDDKPYPCKLLLGYFEDRPLHVLVAKAPASGECQVITVYEPDPRLWENDFKTRRP